MKWRLYRLVMRVAHRFNWHYAPRIGPIGDECDYELWCKWCGMRYTMPNARKAKVKIERPAPAVTAQATEGEKP